MIIMFMFIFVLFNLQTIRAATNLNNLGGTFSTAPSVDGRTGNCATSGFVCTFSESTCPYGNTDGDNQWLKATGSPDHSVWQSSVGTTVLPDFPSAAVQLTDSIPFGTLLSDPITCQDADGQIGFTYWVTNNAVLQVCAVSLRTNQDILCSENYNQQSSSYPGPVTFRLPQPINEPFVIRFMVSSPPEENFVILDELGYFGSGCSSGSTCNSASTVQATTIEGTTPFTDPSTIINEETTVSTVATTTDTTPVTFSSTSTSRQPTSSTSTKTTTVRSTTDVCSQLKCNFETNFCQYSNYHSSTVPWQRRELGFGVPLSRITDISPNGGYFLATLLKANRRDVSILQSPQFRLDSDKILNFKFYRATMGSTIKFCAETDTVKYSSTTGMKECPSIIPVLSAANARRWNSASVTLSKSVTKFYLVAIHEVQTSGDAGIAIDDLVINGC